LIGKPKVILTSTYLDDFPVEFKILLDEFVDIIVDDFPNALSPIWISIHHIDLILGESLPNKATYNMTPLDNEEMQIHMQELLDKGMIKESLSPCFLPTILSPNKYGGW